MSGAYGDFQEAYKRSLETPFVPRPMMLEEVESCSFAKAAYVQNPDKFFIYEKEEDAVCGTDGFFVPGTHGCQWDFGLVVSGERKGQIFTADNEGAYLLRRTAFMNFIRSGLIGFLIQRMSKRN